MTKKSKLLLGTFSIISISIITMFSIISCGSNADGENSNKTTTSSNPSKPNHNKNSSSAPGSSNDTPKTNANGAINANDNQGIENGNLTDATASWKGASNTNNVKTIQVTNDAFLILNTTNVDNTNNDVTYYWYITNNPQCLIEDSKLMNITHTSYTQLSKQFQDDPHNFIYYVFAIIKSTNAKYELQTDSVVLNFVSNSNLSLEIQNPNSNGTVCVNQNIKIALNSNSIYVNNKKLTYQWYVINGYNKTLKSTSTNTTNPVFSYYANESMYYAVQLEIYEGNKLLATSNVFNFFVSPWADVSLTNPNISNGSLVINDDKQTLTAQITNQNWNTQDGSNLIYTWYELKNANGENSNRWEKILNESGSSLTITSVSVYANYYTNYQVVITSKTNPNINVESNIITVYNNQSIGTPTITTTNASNNTVEVDNNQKVVLSLDLGKMNVPISYLTYSWQEEVNGVWTNLNISTNTYTMTETNSSTHYYRVLIGLNNNFNAISVYTPTFTVEIKPISQELHNQILSNVNKYLDLNNTYNGLNGLLYSYFTNSNSPGYDWLYGQFIGANESYAPFQDYGNFSSSGTSDAPLTLSNISAYFKLQSISMLSKETNPQFNFITLKTFYFCYLNQNTSENSFVEIPSETAFVWNTPFYYTIFDYGYYASDNATNVTTGSVTNEINIDVLASGEVNINLAMNILNVNYRTIITDNMNGSLWNSSGISAINIWGIEFNSSKINSALSDYFGSITIDSGNYIPFNFIDEFSNNNTFILNATTVPNFPNFLNQTSEKTTASIAIFEKKY